MHIVQPPAAGLDIHKLQITASVRLCEPGGAVECATRQFSALPAGLSELTQWLARHRVTAAAMEATGIFWQAPWEALEAADIEPQLLHAQFVKQVQGRKSDVADSLWLARICQFGLCRPSYVPPRKFRQLRQLSRYRRKLVGERSRARNRIHKTLDHDGLRLGGALSDIFGRNGRKLLAGLAEGRSQAEMLASLSGHVRHKRELLEQVLEAQLDAHAVGKLRDLLRAHEAANTSIAELDARLADGLAEMAEQVRLLETVPGIDRGSACAILVELGPDLTACDKTANVAAWAGLAPGNNESADKRRSGRLRRGNATLRATLAECAHGAVRTKGSQFHGYHNALKARMPYKRAILATAHKLLRTIVAMLRDERPYIDPGIDYDKLLVDRNAARWLRKLDEHGCLSPLPFLAHRRRWRSTATDTERGYRGGLPIRRLVGMRWLTAELRDRGVRERFASTMTRFLSNGWPPYPLSRVGIC